MNDKDFRDLVAKMRQAQKDYFRTRDREALGRSKELEKLVDIELTNKVEQVYFERIKITKKTDGYSVEMSRDEYDDILDAVDAGAIWHDENGNSKQSDRCRDLYEEMEAVKKRYLTDEEAATLVNCLCCKNCLPPYQRVNGMCKLDKCKYEPA